MSGGSMDYLYSKVENAEFIPNTMERRAFAKHLQLVARALRAIEWNDSGDWDSGENDAICACLTSGMVLEQLLSDSRKMIKQLRAEIARIAD